MACTYPAELIDTVSVGQSELGDSMVQITGQVNSRRVWREPVGVVGAIVPWNYPFEVTINKLGQALGDGKHGGPETRTDGVVQRHATSGGSWSASRRHPRRRGQRGHVIRPFSRAVN